MCDGHGDDLSGWIIDGVVSIVTVGVCVIDGGDGIDTVGLCGCRVIVSSGWIVDGVVSIVIVGVWISDGDVGIDIVSEIFADLFGFRNNVCKFVTIVTKYLSSSSLR